MRTEFAASAVSLSLALACAAKPSGEPMPSASEPEPVVFVEAVPEPAQPESEAQRVEEPSDADRERAKQLFMEATMAFESGDHAGALAYFEQAYALAPLPPLLFNIAHCHELLGDPAAACDIYRQIDSDPNTDERTRQSAADRSIKLGC